MKLLENRIHFVRIELFEEVVIHLHRRRPRARADAFHFFQRKRAGRRYFLIADAQPLLYVLVKFVSAAKHAGYVGANLNVIASGRLPPQHRVVRFRLGHLQHVQANSLGNFFQNFITQETKLVLRVHHHGNQRRTFDRIASQQLCEFFFQRGR